MSALEPDSSGAGTSSTSPPIPPVWMADAFGPERIPALRQSIRGMEAQLVDLVFQSSSPGLLMDWLRVPLGGAAAAGNLAAVKRLLTAGVETQTPPQRSRPAPLLHEAAKSENESVVEELLQAGVNVHEKDSARANRTALHWAAMVGNGAVVRALTGAGADVDVLDACGRTPLHHACINGHRGVVVFLLLSGACAQKGSMENEPPLHLAAIHNHPGVIEDLLSFGNVSIQRYDVRGLSALHVAAQHSQVEACVSLLRGGADVAQVTSAGFSSLDVAACFGQTGQLLQVLTAADAADVRKRRCSISLSYAVCADKPDTVRDLVALGADVEYRSAANIPHLHFAAARGADKAAEALLLCGADVEARLDGSTPLHFACKRSNTRMVQVLMHWGADEKATDSSGSTARELIGTSTVRPDEELLPEEFASTTLLEDGIRNMLEAAPADRSWRRRGWLVLCRARWLTRIAEEEKRSSAPLASVPDYATGTKKRRGTMPGSALVVKPRHFSLDKGEAPGRKEGEGRGLPETTELAAVLRLGTFGVSSSGGAGQAAGIAKLAGRTLFVAAVEHLLLLQEDPIFREVVTFL